MSFSELGLPTSILNVLSQQSYTKPYPIQKKAIPAILAKKDVLGIAKTGSGKTASYVLPILTNLQRSLGGSASKNRQVNVLIVVPTRELAVQVGDVLQVFGADLPKPIRSLSVYGGVSINPQMKALFGVNILVATPGRLLELVSSNALSLSEVETLVLDEADKMLNLGFKEEMNQIFQLLPQKRQNLLFSATLNAEVGAIQEILLDNPVVIKIEEKAEEENLIDESAYFLTEDKKGPFLRYLIQTEDMQQVLVFTSSTYRADSVAEKLRKNGIDARAIHSKKSQGARTDMLTKFKGGNLRVLVTTDLLARGIDIQFLPYVINYELPRSPKDYIHRIGRTGRAESPGKAISLITEESLHHFKVIQKKIKRRMKMTDVTEVNLQGY